MTYSIRAWFAGQANEHGGVSVLMAATIVWIKKKKKKKKKTQSY